MSSSSQSLRHPRQTVASSKPLNEFFFAYVDFFRESQSSDPESPDRVFFFAGSRNGKWTTAGHNRVTQAAHNVHYVRRLKFSEIDVGSMFLCVCVLFFAQQVMGLAFLSHVCRFGSTPRR